MNAIATAPPIATTREARGLSDIRDEWVIVARDGSTCQHHRRVGLWRYCGTIDTTDRARFVAACATGYFATVTRREADGSRVLLARVAKVGRR